MKLRPGDHVYIKNLRTGGQVVEVLPRSVVVRYRNERGDLVERHVKPDDIEASQ